MSLFDGLEGVGAREPQKRQRPFAYGACPSCCAERIGLVYSPDGQHGLWQIHNFVTFAGTRLPCAATGQRVCDAPARHIIGYPVPRCPHK